MEIALPQGVDDTGARLQHVMRMRLAIVSIAASGLLSAGCLVGPNYSKPELPTPEAIRGAEGAAAGPAFGDAKWWEVLQDEQLQTLVRTAVERNDNVRLAAARVLGGGGSARHHAIRPVSERERGRAGRRRTHGRAGIDGGAQCGSPPN